MTLSSGSASSTYAYDYLGQRIKQITGASTTIYATNGYNLTASSTEKQIMANGILLATIDKNATSSAVTRYVLNDFPSYIVIGKSSSYVSPPLNFTLTSSYE